jgi:Flp pilus assembly protein TadG
MIFFRIVRRLYIFFVALGRDEEGGPLVEFSVLAPVFFLIMFGIVEWGNVFYTRSDMLIAARLAARLVANLSPDQKTSVAHSTFAFGAACGSTASPTPLTNSSYLYNMTFTEDITCTGASSSSNPSYGYVSLSITTPALPVMIFNYLRLVSSSTTLSATATFEEEYVCPNAALAAVNSTPTTGCSCVPGAANYC